MPPSLTRVQQGELQVARDAIRDELAVQHRATRTALLNDAPAQLHETLEAWLDAYVALFNEDMAWSVAAEQADVPDLTNPTELPQFEALVAVPLSPAAERVLLTSSERLGEGRVLALAALIARPSPGLRAELETELARIREAEATWRLLDWLGADVQGGMLTTLAVARHRATQSSERALRARDDDAVRWLLARGVAHTEPFAVSIRMQDVPPTHPKKSHLREQTSFLEIQITTQRVRGPELDPSWSLALRGASGESRHGFAPSRWIGNLWQVQRDSGEVGAVFTEPSPSPVRKARTQSICATLESLPKTIDEIEALTGRTFHRESAMVTAHIGEQRSAALEEAARAWLAAR